MTWDKALASDYQAKNYEKLVAYYEEQVEIFPEELNYYWHLGVAYLLTEKVAEAQAVWLSVFSLSEEDDQPTWISELTAILHSEAEVQTSLNPNLAWLMRTQLAEINPENLPNLLHLGLLELSLQVYQPERLQDWQLLTILEATLPEELELTWQFLLKLVEYPDSSYLPILDLIYPYLESQPCLSTLKNIAEVLGYQQHKLSQAITLAKWYQQKNPGDLSIYKSLFWFNFNNQNYLEALAVAKEFYHLSTTPDLKAFANYQLLHYYTSRAEWSQIPALLQRHQDLLTAITQLNPEQINPLVTDGLIMLGQPLLYLQDEPEQLRPVINKIGSIFVDCASKNLVLNKNSNLSLDRPIRIGYIGHTFRKHSVGWLCRWLIHHQDRDKYPLAIYQVNNIEDEITQRWFQGEKDLIRRCSLNTQAVAEQIAADAIDILVDLDSFTSNVTCHILSLKPAPIQVTWLGCDSSGLSTIDYFIADPYVLPNEADSYYQEKIWRLPHCYLGIDGFEVGVATLTRSKLDIPGDAVIYLNLQNAAKRHPDTISLQLAIIKAVPHSYFLIKGTGDEVEVKELITDLAVKAGVNPNRLRFLPKDFTEMEHRANLAIADVVLDTYPYNGATTTLEVLWMGIPLVTKVGKQFAARNSYTFLHNVGLTEGIAWSDEEYIRWGVELGNNPELRQKIHWRLKLSRRTSPLWNGEGFTREMELAYREMVNLSGRKC